LGAVAFLLDGAAVGLTYAAAAALVCRFGCGGMKRVRAVAELLPTSVPALGFGACGSAPTAAAVVPVGGIE
jgi:hypothetical protein